MSFTRPAVVGELTANVVLGAVQHVGCMNELVPCATVAQLLLCVAQHDLPSA